MLTLAPEEIQLNFGFQRHFFGVSETTVLKTGSICIAPEQSTFY